ncbi:RNA ligase family protein [Paenibacillus sp. FSL R7-0297]|uniref:RNA ligase family protein n=1 Tax=unclassified Paenibacillus TaxID=185978 RepID=UPI0003E2A1DF|nr:RNA ligase family protein [Paenibacillus sp. FSL R7-269]ETT49759.1 DNA ligase III [Paenibacillus sp. FSL R7-269]
MNNFIKFTSTNHLFDYGGHLSRTDKLVSPNKRELFFGQPIVLEEKVDGANIGFSLSQEGEILVQNRGNYITANSHPQFKILDRWIQQHEDALFDILVKGFILYGEWCYAKHTINYDRLPDWFLAFDMWDINENKFLSRQRRHLELNLAGISEVPFVGDFVVTPTVLEGLLLRTKSKLYDGPVEGIYLRVDNSNGYLSERAKIVRPGFIQSIEEHWTKQSLILNNCINETLL